MIFRGRSYSYSARGDLRIKTRKMCHQTHKFGEMEHINGGITGKNGLLFHFIIKIIFYNSMNPAGIIRIKFV